MGVNKYTSKPRVYSKINFVDLLETLTPEIYQTEDLNLSGTELNPVSKVINTHLTIADAFSDIISLSAIAGTQTSGINTISGIAQYFVKQNELTKINPFLLDTKILNPLGYTIADYSTSAEFRNFLSSTILPIIVPASETAEGSLEANRTTLSALTDDSNASSVHNYLIDNLGWFYFLNTSADGGLTYSPSSYVLDKLSRVYLGTTLETIDGVKGLTEYLWRNNETCSFGSYLPTDFISGTADAIVDISAGPLATYTSGTQKLDALQTLLDVIYSPLYIDQQDFTVKNAFDSFIDSQLQLNDLVSKGPFRRFQELMGYHFADISDEIENIGLIYDIENTKDENLRYIADLIGFKLRGGSPSKWRHQLRIAIDLYKSSGTLKAIQAAINALIVDSVFDVSGQVQELWESYLPFLAWYALGTESPLFKNLTTWTPGIAEQAGVSLYDTSSLEENIKLVVDSILLDLYKEYPENFLFFGEEFPVPRLVVVDNDGCEQELYTILNEPGMKPFHYIDVNSAEYRIRKRNAELFGEANAFAEAEGFGALGSGVYLAGDGFPTDGSRPIYLKPKGSLHFLFNYRGRVNYPLPPFEEHKYYKDCTITAPLINLFIEKLKCFLVRDEFAQQVGDFVLDSTVRNTTNIGSLNEFLMFFSSVQVPPNFDSVMLSISDYEKNLLDLWNGKSSHLFVDFDDASFDFSKTTYEADGRYALYEASRVVREFSPAQAIPRVNLSVSAEDDFTTSSAYFQYASRDQNDNSFAGYSSGSILGGFEYQGSLMDFTAGGGDDDRGYNDGRGGLNTFKRADADNILDYLLSGYTPQVPLNDVPRRSLRRRNLKFLLPEEGYYDRTGFNGPVSYDPSTLEYSFPSSLGELTLGYVASAGKFHPVEDPVMPSGVWDACETLNSDRTFSGIDSSATFPYRGLNPLGSDNKMPEIASATGRYVDRCQTPGIIVAMHTSFEDQARAKAAFDIQSTSAYDVDDYWKDTVQSYANEAIASGYVLNVFEDYENFRFGPGPHRVFRDYAKYFAKHSVGYPQIEKTGGNIFAHVFASGIHNCNFEIQGSDPSSFIASSVSSTVPINSSSVWFEGATGTYVADQPGQGVIPLSGSFSAGSRFHAELRNPDILSGIEFCDISGAPATNQFSIFKIDPKTEIALDDPFLLQNTVIKCKSSGGLPRLRFDLSSYGDRRNYFIKDHKFELSVNALVAEEYGTVLGGGSLAVWIHTDSVETSGLFWNWTSRKKWEPFYEGDLSLGTVLSLCHIYPFELKQPDAIDRTRCYGNIIQQDSVINDTSLKNLKKKYLETFTVPFDTRNFTEHNNYEYLDIIPMTNEEYKITEHVHTEDTNYIVEVFFVPNNNSDKYMLIDSINLQDVTLRENAAVPLGFGLQTSGIPFRPFVQEEKAYFSKQQLAEVLGFYNGVAGFAPVKYKSSIGSRTASTTSGILELSGGSRLNYRVSPEWEPRTVDPTFKNYTTNTFFN